MNIDEILSIKDEPELRHALAHMYYAIEALSKGHKKEAAYELRSIEALIFWEDDEHMTAHIEGKANEEVQQAKEEKLQGQEELQGKTQVDNGAARDGGIALDHADDEG